MSGPPLSELTAEIVWESSPDGLVLVDSDGAVVWANTEAERQFGYPASELLGSPVELLIPSELAAVHRSHRGDYAHSPRRRNMGADQRLEGRRKDGSVFPVQVALSPLRLDAAAYTIAAVRDVTVWVESEQRLAESNRRRALAEDHERIARELHDTVIQELFAVGMDLQALIGRVEGEPGDRVNQSIDAIDEIIRSIRTVIFDVSRPRIDARDLRQAVFDLVADVSPALGFEPEVAFDCPPDPPISGVVIEHMLPTLREALTNVARHAVASKVHVEVALSDGVLALTVRDDGQGIDVERSDGRGLTNLARRATLLGGSFSIDGGSDGTLVQWLVPV